ncbi:MAG TPA: GNAT family N-acetyltransferase [Pyrinomonadaceae bacterium]|nr:GNAT family N-acetyltransferase [Pyrinomonadaceae bacterium]
MIYSDKTLSQKLERTEAMANVDFVEARKLSNPESNAEWIEVGGAFAMFDGVESPLTQTFCLGMFEETTHEHFEKLETFFKTKGAEVFHEVSPLADANLLNLLNERGYQLVEMTSVMYREINDEMLAGLQTNPQIVTRIIEKGEEEIWAKTSAGGWATEMEGLADFMFEFGKISASCKGGFPFLAELDGEPISAGMLFINNDVALLAGASTVPEGRRKGAQLALLNARLKFAAEKGCKIAMMGALPGSQSQKNAEKKNFRIAYTRTKWMLK